MRNELFRKGMVYAIVVLFIGVSSIPLAGGIVREKYDSTENLLTGPPMVSNTVSPNVTIILNGTMGENGWFVSCVNVSFIYDPEVIAAVHYKVDGEDWTVYIEPFVVCEDGEHTLYWYYVDNEGNPSAVECIEFKIEKDLIPPETEHDFSGIMGDNDWYTSYVIVMLAAEDDSAGVDYTMYKLDDDVEWQEYMGSFLVTEDGEHTIVYYSVDRVGNEEEPCDPVEFKIDQTDPTIELTIEHIVNKTYRITATVNDETSGVERVEFYINGILEFTDYEAPYEYICELDISSFTKQAIGIAPLEHPSPFLGDEVAAIVYDYAGNLKINDMPGLQGEFEEVERSTAVTKMRTIGVEETVPSFDSNAVVDASSIVIRIDGTMGENGWFVSRVTITIEVTNGNISYIMYRLDDAEWQEYTGPFTFCKDGEHIIEAYGVDSYGNHYDAQAEFKIDQTPPTTTHEFDGIMGENGWYVSDVTVTLSAEDNAAGVDYTMYKLDDDIEWQEYEGSFLVTEVGIHTLYYYSVDLAGNEEDVNEAEFKIDYPPPPPIVIIIIDGAIGANGWYVSCVTITFDYDPEVIAEVHYKIDIGSWQIYTEPFVVTEDGEHTLYYYSVDLAGNEEDVNEVDFKIDQTNPTISLTVEKIGSNTWLLIADVFDETSGVNRVEFYVDDGYVGEVTEAPYEFEYTGSGSVAQATAYDNAGNLAASEEVESHSQSQQLIRMLFIQFLEGFLERFPNAFPMFRYLLGL